jgi:exopolysaccharide production protein ExoQ
VGHTATMKHSVPRLDLFGWLGITIGVIMPVISALLYPVYMHQMQPAWAEWTRLMELPFVACELVIILVAREKGYRDVLIWRKLPRDVIVALGLLLAGLVVSSVFVSKNVAASVTFSIITLVHLRFCSAIFFMATKEETGETKPPIFHRFGGGLVAGLAVLAILTIWKFQLPPPEWTVLGGKIEWASALPGFINVRYFGSWTGAIATGLLVALLYGDPRRAGIYRRWYLLAAGLTFWSGTRAAALAMGAVTLITLISLRRLPSVEAVLRVGALSALAMLGAVVLAPSEEAFSLFARDNLGSADALTSGRLALWHATFARWLEAPLFGWGSGSTFWEVNVGWWHTQPHNTFLLFLVSWGIVGAAGALWLLGRAIISVHRSAMQDDSLRPVAGTLYALLSMSIFAGMLHYPRFVMLIMLCFGVLFAKTCNNSSGTMAN